MKRYVINYGFGLAVFCTPYEPEHRFYTLAGTCFGIRKSIFGFKIIDVKDAPNEPYEKLSFNGDTYIWRNDGARKMIEPSNLEDEDWDTSYCEICRKD